MTGNMVKNYKRIMESKITNLYKVYAKGWNSPAYVAADFQQDAVEKVAESNDTENKFHFTVEYVGEVFI